MSDAESPGNGTPLGPAEREVGALEAAFVPRCPICGTRSWETRSVDKPEEGKEFREVIVAFHGDQMVRLSVRNFICSNCGFVRSHVVDKLKGTT